jgi:hypothetical protein
MIDRRTFLRFTIRLAAGAALALAGLAGRAASMAARAFTIPKKTFRPERLRDPHDLAG